MGHSRISLVLVVWGVVLANLQPAAYAQPGGAVPQPTRDASAADQPSGDSNEELKALISSPEARSVAAFRCSSLQTPGCPLNDGNSKVFTDHFDDTLLTGQGATTKLIDELEKMLDTSYGSDALWPATVDYAIVHLVKFSDDGSSHRGRWLLFRRMKGRVQASMGTRIMGSKRVAIVFVHLGQTFPAGVTGDDISARYANVEYRAIAKPKLPINVQRLLGLLKIATKTQGAEDKAVAVLGFGVYDHLPVPCDLTVFGAKIGATPAGYGIPITYDNEGKYFWDASVAVPINKITLLDYDETEDTFTPKVINKQSIYGCIDIYPFPVDIKDGMQRWLVPRAMVGIGMTGRPGENFLLAGAFGIKEFQVFIGSAFANQRVLKPGTDPANGENYTQRYASRLAYGINVPVLAVLKKLGGSD